MRTLADYPIGCAVRCVSVPPWHGKRRQAAYKGAIGRIVDHYAAEGGEDQPWVAVAFDPMDRAGVLFPIGHLERGHVEWVPDRPEGHDRPDRARRALDPPTAAG